jgi:ABC-type transport system substrate-binding protein
VLISNWNLVLASPQKYSYLTIPPWSGLTSTLGLNTQLYPTNITDVRQAIVHALNYTAIREAAFLGQMSPYVGPEYPAWSDYYNLGNYSNYSYNVTLAQQYLSKANISSLPTFSMNIVADCQFCSNLAETVQADLAQIGITVQISVQDESVFYNPYGSYSYELNNSAAIGNLVEYFGTWASGALTPAADWVDFVSNQSEGGNTALYYNPTVQAAVDAFTSTTNVTAIQSLVKVAQTQIYADAPYAWIGVSRLWYSDGSLVWQAGVVKSFLVDPTWSSQTTAPIFNTVTFV